MFFVMWGMFFLVLWWRRDRWWQAALAGFLLGFATTIRYTEARGRLAGAMIVKDGYDLVLISHDGTVIRTAAEGISRMGRATQGVRVMNLREGDHVSAIARITEPQAALVEDGADGGEPAKGDDVPELPASSEPPDSAE